MKYLYQNNKPVGEIWHDSAETNWGSILIIGTVAIACIAVGFVAVKMNGGTNGMQMRRH